MNNKNIDGSEEHKVKFTNSAGRIGSGSAVALVAGMAIVVGGIFGICLGDVAINGTGVMETAGTFYLPKATGVGTDLAEGTVLGFDFANDRVTKDLSSRVIGQVAKAATTTDATVLVRLSPVRPTFADAFTCTATENSAKTVDFTLPFPVAKAMVQVLIRNVSNVVRVPQGAHTAQSTYVLRVADSGLATNEVVMVQAIQVDG